VSAPSREENPTQSWARERKKSGLPLREKNSFQKKKRDAVISKTQKKKNTPFSYRSLASEMYSRRGILPARKGEKSWHSGEKKNRKKGKPFFVKKRKKKSPFPSSLQAGGGRKPRRTSGRKGRGRREEGDPAPSSRRSVGKEKKGAYILHQPGRSRKKGGVLLLGKGKETAT